MLDAYTVLTASLCYAVLMLSRILFAMQCCSWPSYAAHFKLPS